LIEVSGVVILYPQGNAAILPEIKRNSFLPIHVSLTVISIGAKLLRVSLSK